MATQPVGARPPKITATKRLKGSVSVGPGETARIGYCQLLNMGFPVLETLYYNGSAGSGQYLTFNVLFNGVQLPYDWATALDNPVGVAGVPAQIGQEFPPGGLLEVWVTNSHAVETDEDTFDAYCDGEVEHYVSQIHA